MRSVVLAVLMVAVFGCGGGVDEGFAGTWSGTGTFRSPGKPTYSGQTTISLAVVDGDLHVPGCTASSPPLVVSGSGRAAEWSGQHSCPAPVQSCPTTVVTITRYTAALLGDNRIETTGESTVTGCGSSFQVFGSFSGTK